MTADKWPRRRMATVVLFVCLGVMSTAVALFAGGARADVAHVQCIAHRGGTSPDHDEETIGAYTESLEAGVPEVEGDVRWSSTGFPYLLHDADLGLFDHPAVNLADVSGSVATGATYLSPKGDKLASLYALRELLLDHPAARVQLELKTVLTDAQWDMLATRLDPIRNRTTLTSFNLGTVRAAQDHGYRTGWLSSGDTTSTAAPIYAEAADAIDAGHVAALRAVGVKTQAWTPDTTTEWDALAAKGVSAIITNNYQGCLTWETTRQNP